MAKLPFYQSPQYLRLMAQLGLRVDTTTGNASEIYPGSFTPANAARLAGLGLNWNPGTQVFVELTPDAHERIEKHLSSQETARHMATEQTSRHSQTEETNRLKYTQNNETIRNTTTQVAETARQAEVQTTIREANKIKKEIEVLTQDTNIQLKKIESSTDKSIQRTKAAKIITPIVALLLLAGWKGGDIYNYLCKSLDTRERMHLVDASTHVSVVRELADRDVLIAQSDTEARIAEATARINAAAAGRPVNNTTYIYQTPEVGSGESSRQTVDVNIRVDNPQQEQAVNQIVERVIQEPVYVNNNPQVVQHVFEYAHNNPYYYNQIPYHMYEYCYHHYPSIWNSLHANVRMGFSFGHRRDDYLVDNNTSTVVNNNIVIDNQNNNNNTNTSSSRSSSRSSSNSRSDSSSNSSSSSRDPNRGNGHGRPNRPGQTIPDGNNNGHQVIPDGNNNGDQTIPGENNNGNQTIPGRNNDGNQTIPGRNNSGNQNIPGSGTRSTTQSTGSTTQSQSSRRLSTPSISTGPIRSQPSQSYDRSGEAGSSTRSSSSSVRNSTGGSTRSAGSYNSGTSRSGGGRTQGDRGSSGRR